MRGPEVNWHLVGASFGTRKQTTRRRFASEPRTRAHGQPRQSRASVKRVLKRKLFSNTFFPLGKWGKASNERFWRFSRGSVTDGRADGQ